MRSQLGAGEFLKLCSGLSVVHIYASQQHTSGFRGLKDILGCMRAVEFQVGSEEESLSASYNSGVARIPEAL